MTQKTHTKRCPKGDPKNHKKAIRAEFLGVLEGSIKRSSVQGLKKWDFAIIYYTWGRSGVSKRDPVWDHFGDRFYQKTHKKRVPENHQKSVQKNTPKWTPKWDHLGVISRPASKQLGIWGFWLHLGPLWLHLGGHFGGHVGGHFVWFWMPFCA